ncbi:hypothetical protein HDV63DRAFT_204252 [Trichoderma sp. SZMC 28014]
MRHLIASTSPRSGCFPLCIASNDRTARGTHQPISPLLSVSFVIRSYPPLQAHADKTLGGLACLTRHLTFRRRTYPLHRENGLYNESYHDAISPRKSNLAQWKRAGLITRRSHDRNVQLLNWFLSFFALFWS